MKNKLNEKLRLEIVNNKIVNINNLLLKISKENNYEMLKEYYEFLNNNISKTAYEDLDVLLLALNSRVNALETKVKAKQELKKVQTLNKDLNRISLIEEAKEENDSNKDMYYLKFTERDGSLTILEITNPTLLLNLISTSALATNADNFVELLKRRYFNELPTFNLGKDQINILTVENSHYIKDKANFTVEKDQLSKTYPTVVPKVSFDSNQERLYHINNLIIKFHDENGKREPKILNNETLNQEEPKYINETNEGYNEENRIDITYDEIENTYVETEEIKSLVAKYIRDINLEKSELIKIYAFVSETISKYETGYENAITEVDKMLLDTTIDYLRTKNCNNVEQTLLSRYNTYYESQEKVEGQSNEYTKSKKLYDSSPIILNDDGISLTIIIITVTILLGTVLAAVMLAR